MDEGSNQLETEASLQGESQFVIGLRVNLANYREFGTDEYRQRRLAKASEDNGRPVPAEVIDRWVRWDRVRVLNEALWNKRTAESEQLPVPDDLQSELDEALDPYVRDDPKLKLFIADANMRGIMTGEIVTAIDERRKAAVQTPPQTTS